MYRIPFNKPFIVGEELYYMAQSVMSGHMRLMVNSLTSAKPFSANRQMRLPFS